ncbi:MAG: DoxX family protein [Serpentinimonas sp.]|jgi:putative oxidoreductase|nr:DoxX family protein [Serpentinimonas sp.]
MNALQAPFALLARLLMVALFLPAGIRKIGGFEGTAGYIASVGLPFPTLGAAIAVVVEIVAPLLLLVGLQTRWAALVLAIFTLAASVFFHNFWAMPAEQQFMQQLMFMKNIGVVGGLLAITAFGAGAFSLDARRKN